ncbi:type IV pilus assembly protein PilM [Salinibacterium sp. CAN_S4]|uniref:type IV pilus assembly protein PilM n=1 Tax=Salinibacterium sp. CAN_S4 TaxID=2787727 RepID=UPI0018F02437
MARSVVGLDFGAGIVRAAEVSEQSKPRPKLLRYHEAQLPQGSAQRGEVLEIDTVASTLKQLWSRGGFKSKDVILGVGNQRVLARDLTVPKMPLQQIRESLPFQVQEMLPVPVADALLDFYPVSEAVTEAGPVIHGLLVAAVKESVMSNVQAVQAAGLNPIEVDLIPFALSRALLSAANAKETVGMIHVGSVTTTVVVASGGTPQFVRIIPNGGNDVTAALVSRFDIADAQAEQVKRGFGLTQDNSSPEWAPAIETIREVTGDLLNSVRNTISFYINTRPTTPIRRLVIGGGGAQLAGFGTALSEITRIPVSDADPFERFTIARTVDSALLEASRPNLAVALGLTIGGK